MGKNTQNSFFICQGCLLKQNIDQTVHISENYCVRCYNKEQMHRESMKKFQFYRIYLEEQQLYTKIRKSKLKDLIRLNEILLPQTIFILEDGEIRTNLKEIQRDAIKKGLQELEKKYHLKVNEDAITYELTEKIKPIWQSKRIPSESAQNKLIDELEPFIDKKIESKKEFFKDFRKFVRIPYFTLIKGKYQIKYMRPFQFNEDYLLRTVKTYRKRIIKYTNQRHRFQYFVEQIAQICQFQTVDDGLKYAIEKYSMGIAKKDIEIFGDRMLAEINSVEDSPLIPNIAKYIMDNSEYIFETWYTKILPFDKSRFMASQAHTGSRTDFVVRLQYHFRSYELKMIADNLRDTTEMMIREKGKNKIAKLLADKGLTEEKRNLKIQRTQDRMEKNLQPEKLKQIQIQNVNGSPMVARFLLINAEKAFNIVLNKIIRFHYKRLRITTPVQYITNVLESGAEEIRKDLKAFYLIQSREW
ncbi:MAG: hypothetical protein ACTSRK_14635 [Promethearchaeota archaeon]